MPKTVTRNSQLPQLANMANLNQHLRRLSTSSREEGTRHAQSLNWGRGDTVDALSILPIIILKRAKNVVIKTKFSGLKLL